MADSSITVQDLTTLGLTETFVNATATHVFDNDGNTLLHVKNDSSSAVVVTILSQVSPVPVGTAKADISVSVGATAEKLIGRFPQAAYNDSSGMVRVNYGATAGVTVAVVSLGVT